MFAILGSVEFDLITYFDGLETRFGAEYAEHALIARKPRLQFVGDKLDEVRIDLVFHVSYCDPEAELVRLRLALVNHEVLSLVFGNGDYKGRFVVTELSATGRHTDSAGTLLSVEASITLREFTGKTAQPLAPAIRPSGNTPKIPMKGALVTALPVKVAPTPASSMARAVTGAKSALSTAGNVLSAVATVRSMASGNLLGAAARLPELTRSLSAALPSLDSASKQMEQFKGLPSVASDTSRIALGIMRVRDEFGSLAGNFSVATPSDLHYRLSASEGAVSRANAEMVRATLPLARLAAQAVTRSV